MHTQSVVGVATISSIGALGGFAGPSIVGWLSDTMCGTAPGLTVVGASMMTNSLLIAISCGRYAVRQSVDRSYNMPERGDDDAVSRGRSRPDGTARIRRPSS